MSDQLSPEQADDEFFAALTAGDVSRLEPLLDERFLIVDVMSGAVADRAALLAALDERILEFGHVELIERATTATRRSWSAARRWRARSPGPPSPPPAATRTSS